MHLKWVFYIIRNRLGPTETLVVGGPQNLNTIRNIYNTGGGGGIPIEPLLLPSVAGATFNKSSIGSGMGGGVANVKGSLHLLGQENHTDHLKGQGNKSTSPKLNPPTSFSLHTG